MGALDLCGAVIGVGTGTKKVDAEKRAASEALKLLKKQGVINA